jgi:hypothetical protein
MFKPDTRDSSLDAIFSRYPTPLDGDYTAQ